MKTSLELQFLNKDVPNMTVEVNSYEFLSGFVKIVDIENKTLYINNSLLAYVSVIEEEDK